MEEAAFRLSNAAMAKGKAVVMMGPLGCEHAFGKEAVVISVVKQASCYNCQNDVRFCFCLAGLGKVFLCLGCWPCRMVATKNMRHQEYVWSLQLGHEPLMQLTAKP